MEYKIPLSAVLKRKSVDTSGHSITVVDIDKDAIYRSKDQDFLVFQCDKGLEIVRTTDSVGYVFVLDESVSAMYKIVNYSGTKALVNKCATTYKESFSIKDISDPSYKKATISQEGADNGIDVDLEDSSIILSLKNRSFNPTKEYKESEIIKFIDSGSITSSLVAESNRMVNEMEKSKAAIISVKSVIEKMEKINLGGQIKTIIEAIKKEPGRIEITAFNRHVNKEVVFSMEFRVPWCYLLDKCKFNSNSTTKYAFRVVLFPGFFYSVFVRRDGTMWFRHWSDIKNGKHVYHPHINDRWCLGEFEGIIRHQSKEAGFSDIVFTLADAANSYNIGSPYIRVQGHHLTNPRSGSTDGISMRADTLTNETIEKLEAVPFPDWVRARTGLSSIWEIKEMTKQEEIKNENHFTSIPGRSTWHSKYFFTEQPKEEKKEKPTIIEVMPAKTVADSSETRVVDNPFGRNIGDVSALGVFSSETMPNNTFTITTSSNAAQTITYPF